MTDDWRKDARDRFDKDTRQLKLVAAFGAFLAVCLLVALFLMLAFGIGAP